MFNAKQFGSKVALHRFNERQTLRQAAKSLNIAASTLCRIENGAKPDIDTFAALCNWIGVEYGEFLNTKINPYEK